MDFGRPTGRRDRWPYEDIAAVIEAAITSGELAPGDPVPSEQRIMQESGAARGTVRHAIASLRDRGLVYTRPRLGTFVSPPPGD